MQIIPLSEGRFTVDASKQFIPFLESDDVNQRSKGSLLVEIQPFVVITENDIILLDTGLGFSDAQGNLQIHNNLMRAGINPLDVTLVLMSHLHKDHAGGISRKDSFLTQRRISFPHARYVINRQELNASITANTSSYIREFVEPLTHSDQLILTEGDGILTKGIRYSMCGGHSPWHQVFWLEEAGKIIFFGGDVAPQLIQMKTKFIAKYDHDGKQAALLRNKWWEQGSKEKWTFLFYHDIKYPMYRAE